MDKVNRYVWVNGKIQEDHVPIIPIETKGLMYGAGCFETIRSYKGRFLHFERHIDRLKRGVEYLKIRLPESYDLQIIQEAARSIISKNQLESRDALVRIQVSDSGGRGYRADSELDPIFMITADQAGGYKEGYKVVTVSNRVIPGICRPNDLKLCNCLHYMEAWREARSRNVNDALMLTVDGIVAETSIANIFWKKGNNIYTPSELCDILPGIFRGIVIDILSEMPSYHVNEGRYFPSDVTDAELIWVTNSVKQIQPVTSYDGKKIPGESNFYEDLWYQLDQYKKENLN
jgi:branched-subunit amino acid aminotransferase/4-amino-4-deoxychorismate lyase